MEWFKSQASNPSGNCVEVAAGETGIHVRDSKRPLWGRLTFSPSEWEQFVAEVKAGRHDVSALLIAADVAIHVDGCSGESCQGECERLSRRAEDKPQVTEPETARADKENSNESEVREMGTENQSVPEPAVWTAEQLAVGREFARLMEASGSDPWR